MNNCIEPTVQEWPDLPGAYYPDPDNPGYIDPVECQFAAKRRPNNVGLHHYRVLARIYIDRFVHGKQDERYWPHG